jgi:tRNA(His) 5'-end guanylyltransferase
MSVRDESQAASLGARMKGYEQATRQVLPRRTYTIIRVDGRAFHTYLKNAQRPFDEDFVVSMQRTGVALCEEMSGAVFAYGQSDEISIVLYDFAATTSQPWLGGNVQKLASVAASIATANFCIEERMAADPPGFYQGSRMIPPRIPGLLPTFDGRVYTIPDPVEVANYFVWRQQDAIRNSVSMAASAHFSEKELDGKSWGQRQDMLFTQKGVNWNAYRPEFRRGWVVARRFDLEIRGMIDDPSCAVPVSNPWEFSGAPLFAAEPKNFLSRMIPDSPSLKG